MKVWKCKQGVNFDKSTTTVKEERNWTLHQTKDKYHFLVRLHFICLDRMNHISHICSGGKCRMATSVGKHAFKFIGGIAFAFTFVQCQLRFQCHCMILRKAEVRAWITLFPMYPGCTCNHRYRQSFSTVVLITHIEDVKEWIAIIRVPMTAKNKPRDIFSKL